MVLLHSKNISLICATTLFCNVAAAQIAGSKDYGGKFGIGFAMGGGGLAAGIPLRLNVAPAIVLEGGMYVQGTTITTTIYSHNFYGAVIKKEMITEKKILPAINGGLTFIAGENRIKGNKIIKNGIVFRAGKTLKKRFTENLLAIGWSRERFMDTEKHKSYIFELGVGMFMYGDGNSPLGWASDRDIPVMPVLLWKFHWNFYVVK